MGGGVYNLLKSDENKFIVKVSKWRYLTFSAIKGKNGKCRKLWETGKPVTLLDMGLKKFAGDKKENNKIK